jgi:hypothetical protein
LRLRLYGYNDHDNLDHGYIMIGYLDIDSKNTIYSNSRTLVNSVRVITCIHATPAEGREERPGRHQRCRPIRDAVDDDKGGDDGNATLQIQSQSSASLPLRLRGNVRLHVPVRLD